jgi:DNA primase
MTPALVDRYHQALPARIRAWLQDRGISENMITHAVLGWTGSALAIPIFDCAGRFAFVKFRRDPEERDPARPKYWSSPGAHADLYGWENMRARHERLVICEGELDRLCLESLGIPAVSSTGGAGVFKAEWAGAFHKIPEVYVCFDHDAAGRRGAARVARLMPHARIVSWPPEIGVGGDVTDFFVRLGKRAEEFYALLQAAKPLPRESLARPSIRRRVPSVGSDRELEHLKARISIVNVIGKNVALSRSGRTYIGCCCFHDDRVPSLVVYPDTQSFYCFGCGVGGDVFRFLMGREHLTFREAVAVVAQQAGMPWIRTSQKPQRV